MIIDGVVKRKSGTITIHYTKGGKHYGLTLTPHEIVENYEAAQQSVHLTGLCPFCGEPIATEHAHEFCYPPEPPRK